MAFILYFIKWFDQMRKRESKGLVIGGSGVNEKNREWGESKDKEKEKIIKILNTHVIVTAHICTVTVAILYLYTSLHPLMWVIFCSNCVKLVTFSILHIYAQADGDALSKVSLTI